MTTEAKASHEPAKLIFLDLDGVLNRTERAKQICLDPDLCARLQQICERSGNVNIVLTTFWREFIGYISYILRRFGVTAPVIGATPATAKVTPRRPRATEIAEYIDIHKQEQVSFVIIDDRADAAVTPEQTLRFVRTDYNKGLTQENVDEAVRILSLKNDHLVIGNNNKKKNNNNSNGTKSLNYRGEARLKT